MGSLELKIIWIIASTRLVFIRACGKFTSPTITNPFSGIFNHHKYSFNGVSSRSIGSLFEFTFQQSHKVISNLESSASNIDVLTTTTSKLSPSKTPILRVLNILNRTVYPQVSTYLLVSITPIKKVCFSKV